MEIEISKDLIMSLKRIYETEENLLSYINYYKYHDISYYS